MTHEDFTVAAYGELINIAAQKYRFAGFLEPGNDRHVLWRHDIDFSVHRALRLARIEHAEGLKATYFFMLRSSFYNLFEDAVVRRARNIAALGHYIGLHFVVDERERFSASEEQAAHERQILSDLLGTQVSVLSFHNPTEVEAAVVEKSNFGGMVNVYGRELTQRYTYCSDSNGYWRHRSLRKVLVEDVPERLHVLTHPAWWTDDPMPPRQRVVRAVSGRAAAIMEQYDEDLRRHGRENIG